MKKYYLLLFFAVVLLGISFSGCKKDCELNQNGATRSALMKIVFMYQTTAVVITVGGNDGGGGNGDGERR